MNPGEIWHVTSPLLDPKNEGRCHWVLVTARHGNFVYCNWIVTHGDENSNDQRLDKERFPEEFAKTGLKHTCYLIFGRELADEIENIEATFTGYAVGALLRSAEFVYGAEIEVRAGHPEYHAK